MSQPIRTTHVPIGYVIKSNHVRSAFDSIDSHFRACANEMRNTGKELMTLDLFEALIGQIEAAKIVAVSTEFFCKATPLECDGFNKDWIQQ